MAEQTKNLGFTKPDVNEFYNVGVQNENWDKLDDVIGIPSISAANEEEFDTKLLEIVRTFPIPSVRFINVYSTTDSFLMGGRAVAIITKSIPDSDDGEVNATVEIQQVTQKGVLKMFKNILIDVVSPLEYLNPPMVLGVEYRTTERCVGKPVYVKRFSTGAITHNSNIVYSENGESVTPIRSAVNVGTYLLPYYANGNLNGGTWSAWYDISGNTFIGYMGSGRSSTEFIATVWYTKE